MADRKFAGPSLATALSLATAILSLATVILQVVTNLLSSALKESAARAQDLCDRGQTQRQLRGIFDG